MRARLAGALSAVASWLLTAANRIDPETVQLVEELAEDPVDVTPAAPQPTNLGPVEVTAPSREEVIGMTMRIAGTGAWLIVHAQGCNGGDACTGCRAVAMRSVVGVA